MTSTTNTGGISHRMVSVVWGSVPDWIGAIGTAGALLLGFGILISDRRARNREQSSQVSVYLASDNERGTRYVMRNRSDQPIDMPYIRLRTRTRFEKLRFLFQKRRLPPKSRPFAMSMPFTGWGLDDTEIEPNGTREIPDLQLWPGVERAGMREMASFIDARSRSWVLDTRSGSLKTGKAFIREIERDQEMMRRHIELIHGKGFFRRLEQKERKKAEDRQEEIRDGGGDQAGGS